MLIGGKVSEAGGSVQVIEGSFGIHVISWIAQEQRDVGEHSAIPQLELK